MSAASDLMTMVKSAAEMADGTRRDMALLAALRTCRRELEAAEVESDAAKLRLEDAKEKFECTAKILSVVPSLPLLSTQPDHDLATEAKNDGNGGALSSDINQYWKRMKTSSSTNSLEANDVDESAPITLPTNPIHMPAAHSLIDAGGEIVIMSEQDVALHRENFYQRLLGISASEVGGYTPALGGQPNLRSKAQLAEGIHIVQHWDTGTDGLDPAQFRSKHKSWYQRLKPVTQNLGRRTGIHVRTLEPQQGQQLGEAVLCRYSKDGIKSTVYLDITQVYDALFEIHCMEHNHLRGKDAVKQRADDLYANIPDMQVKCFIEACPVCIERRGGSQEELAKVQVS